MPSNVTSVATFDRYSLLRNWNVFRTLTCPSENSYVTPKPSASTVCVYQVQFTFTAGFCSGKCSEKGKSMPAAVFTTSSVLASLPLVFLSCQLRTVAPWLLKTIL